MKINLRDYISPIETRYIRKNDAEVIKVNSNYLDLLTKSKILSFDAVWHTPAEIIKKIKERTVEKISFSCGFQEEENYFFYIKKHRQPVRFWRKILPHFCASPFMGEGIKEFDNYCDFRQKGLGTAIPVAAGQKYTSHGIESFLITQDFFPFIDLEEIVLNRPEILHQVTDKITVKRKILDAIASYANKMHIAGFNQKDFNATHILLYGFSSEHFQMCLFDLQRVDRNILNRFRWPIKALAELNFTLPADHFTDEDRLYLFKKYLKKDKLNLLNKLQWFWIKKKTERIAKHSRKRGLAPKIKFTI